MKTKEIHRILTTSNGFSDAEANEIIATAKAQVWDASRKNGIQAAMFGLCLLGFGIAISLLMGNVFAIAGFFVVGGMFFLGGMFKSLTSWDNSGDNEI